MISYTEVDARVDKVTSKLLKGPHKRLAGARIRFMFSDSTAGTGCSKHGKVKVASDFERYLTGDGNQDTGDDIFVIVNRMTWAANDDKSRVGQLDHLLSHVTRDEDKDVWVKKDHDLNEFSDVLERNGAYDESAIPALRKVRQVELPGLGGVPAKASANPPLVDDELPAATEADAGPIVAGSVCPECRDGILQSAIIAGQQALKCESCGFVHKIAATEAVTDGSEEGEVEESDDEEDDEEEEVDGDDEEAEVVSADEPVAAIV